MQKDELNVNFEIVFWNIMFILVINVIYIAMVIKFRTVGFCFSVIFTLNLEFNILVFIIM
jgi:hypothetical protein